MKELSLHILDVAENGINAGADRVRITVEEARNDNRLRIIIVDNGRGIPPDLIQNVTDPFYTTRTTRRVGLGLSLLEAAARQCNGSMRVDSMPGKGASVIAEFAHDHIDRAPLGDMAGTLISLIMGYPDVEFEYSHLVNTSRFEMKTIDIKNMFEDRPVSDPAVFRKLRQIIQDGLKRLKTNED
ncbi:MAG: ATP-binding protein [Desulfobacteraceae bacterium]|nr:ATP-binding protein [Desulfobacteraceae bacterium]MBC2753979.1 ATP-binding protein [Desulfobacteraceae bacterium]